MDNIVGCGKSILDSVMGQLAVLGPAINCGGSFWNFDERSELSVLGPKLDKAHLLGESPWAKLRMQKATYSLSIRSRTWAEGGNQKPSAAARVNARAKSGLIQSEETY